MDRMSVTLNVDLYEESLKLIEEFMNIRKQLGLEELNIETAVNHIMLLGFTHTFNEKAKTLIEIYKGKLN